jgi:F-box and WD-40 domain protein CDC4
MDVRRPRSSQTVSVHWGEENGVHGGGHRFQFEVSECVETKTITTTTTTKRTFPPVFVRETRPLETLDTKEYPLAGKPVPAELAKFKYCVPGVDADEPVSMKQVSLRALLFTSSFVF